MAVQNSCFFIGNLTRDAELKYTNSGLAICKFSVAVNDRVKRGDDWQDEVSYFEMTMFGKRGESLNQYLVKGTPVALDCKAKQDRWEQEGQKRTKITFIADDIKLLGGKKEGQGSPSRQGDEWAPNHGGEYFPPIRDAPVSAPAAASDDGFEDQIPF